MKGLDVQCSRGYGSGLRIEGLGFGVEGLPPPRRFCHSERPGTDPGTDTEYPPTALPTVGPYALPVPGFVPGGASATCAERSFRRRPSALVSRREGFEFGGLSTSAQGLVWESL